MGMDFRSVIQAMGKGVGCLAINHDGLGCPSWGMGEMGLSLGTHPDAELMKHPGARSWFARRQVTVTVPQGLTGESQQQEWSILQLRHFAL